MKNRSLLAVLQAGLLALSATKKDSIRLPILNQLIPVKQQYRSHGSIINKYFCQW